MSDESSSKEEMFKKNLEKMRGMPVMGMMGMGMPMIKKKTTEDNNKTSETDTIEIKELTPEDSKLIYNICR